MTAYCHYKAMDARTYTIGNLCELSGYSRRTIRYYIQEGLLEPPAGRGRGGLYNDSHVARLRQIRKLQNDGVPLFGIRKVLACGVVAVPHLEREVWIRCPVAAGIEMHIERRLEERERRKIERVLRIARSIMEGDEVDGK